MRRGIATFTLDHGKCPPWLYERMVKLGCEMVYVLVDEFGPDEFIKRISDPVWFQSLGTVLAFDWNASGLTTILTAALKESIRGHEKELGIFICGGKGKTSRKTPNEIDLWGDRVGFSGGIVSNLKYNSKMAAKVDSALVQDGFQIYHHSFFFSRSGAWAVVQQGMNTNAGTARRYHWYSKNINDLVSEPHRGIVSDATIPALNLVAKKSEQTRTLSVELVGQGYESLMKEVKVLRRYASHLNQSLTLKNRQGELFTFLNLENREFHTHPVQLENFGSSKYLEKILYIVADQEPDSYEKLVAIEGVGPKTVRALALVGEVLYGAAPSYEDPSRYSFALGGKDGTPYPVDRTTYDDVISVMKKLVARTRFSALDKAKMVHRLESQR